MAEIVWTEEAVEWLSEIKNYIAANNPSAAFRTVKGIYDKIQTLSEFPEIGHLYPSRPELNVRILLFDHYRIAYRFNGTIVEILGIFHGALNLERLLKE